MTEQLARFRLIREGWGLGRAGWGGEGVKGGLPLVPGFVPVGSEMTAAPTPQEVIDMLRDEGLADLPAGFPAEGDLFAAGMDSMAVMQLIVIAEERFGAVIAPQDAGRENLGTARDLAALIGRRMA
jgi:acyl carrier protein